MSFSFSKEFSASATTNIENVFFYEYLPVSDGNSVKVYLYGLFLCQNKLENLTVEEFAKNLSMTTKQVLDCFAFWEEFGLVNLLSTTPFEVEYLPIRSIYSSKPKKYKTEKYTEFCKSLQVILPGRMISTGEYSEYFSIMENYHIKPEAMLMIVKYCVDKKGADIGYKYISKVAKDFGNRGIITVEKVENELSTYILRTAEIEKILRALSIKRQPELDDFNLFKKWTNELNFEPDNIVYAGKTLKKASMQKLDEFLLELYSIKSFSKEEIKQYANSKQNIFELAIKINKALGVYVDVLDAVIDNFTKKWLSFGFDEQSLLFIASECFISGKNTLQDMDDMIENLRNKGIVTLSSLGDYFEEQKSTDEFIKKFLLITGVNRRPTPWDRENIATWKNWNFSEEMILEAGKLSSGKSSPISYVNAILSDWKNKNVFNPCDIGSVTYSVKDNSQEAYNKEYERRREIALNHAQANKEKAFSVEGFKETYARINSIEKDLAFAELSANEELLKSLEKEKENLVKRANQLLETVGICLKDLSPNYACKKCNDTGYVGTHRCDCFDLKIN